MQDDVSLFGVSACHNCGIALPKEEGEAYPPCCHKSHPVCKSCWYCISRVLDDEKQVFPKMDDSSFVSLKIVSDHVTLCEAHNARGSCLFCTSFLEARIPTNARILFMLSQKYQPDKKFDLNFYIAKHGPGNLDKSVSRFCGFWKTTREIVIARYRSELAKDLFTQAIEGRKDEEIGIYSLREARRLFEKYDIEAYKKEHEYSAVLSEIKKMRDEAILSCREEAEPDKKKQKKGDE
jgi:hypothetical protein